MAPNIIISESQLLMMCGACGRAAHSNELSSEKHFLDLIEHTKCPDYRKKEPEPKEPDPVIVRSEPETEDAYARRFLIENPEFLEV